MRLFLIAACALMLSTGCVDEIQYADSGESDNLSGEFLHAGKLRHPRMIRRATKTGMGKEGNGIGLGLILKLDDHELRSQRVLQRYRVLNRYKVLRRYKVLKRYEYDEIFNGLAITVEDSLGMNDYDAFIATLMDDPDVDWFEPDFDISSPTPSADDGVSRQMIPWSVATIGGAESWARSGDGSGTVPVDLYVIDSGVSNPDINVVEAVDFSDSLASDPTDYDGHGTHIAGIAAAVDNAEGIVGVAPGARVHNYKVIGSGGSTESSTVLAAIDRITAEKRANPSRPMVVNISLGEDIGTELYSALDDAIDASSALGVVYVVSAGNEGVRASHVTPAHVARAITVGSYAVDGVYSDFSNHGPVVDILAPGEDVMSLAPSSNGAGDPIAMSGTSMAAGHVSGAALLYLAQNPGASADQVLAHLLARSQSFVMESPQHTEHRSVWVGESDFSGEISFTKAEWRETGSVRIEGYAAPNVTVAFYDTDSGAALATQTTPADGRFKLEVEGLATISCHIKAVAGTTVVLQPAQDAPGSCVEVLGFSKVEWQADKAELKVEGSAPPGSNVRFYHAEDASYLGETLTDSEGEFKHEIPGIEKSPCSVRAVSRGIMTRSMVFKSGYDCVGAAGTAVFDLTKMEWDAGKAKFKLEGYTSGGNVVEFSNPHTGVTQGSTVAERDGTFKVDLPFVGDLTGDLQSLCFLAADSGGLRIERLLYKAPGASCGQHVGLRKTEWDRGNSRIKLEGMAPPNTQVKVVSEADGAHLGDFQADEDGEFKYEIDQPEILPCYVRLSWGSKHLVRLVEKTEGLCVPGGVAIDPGH